MYFYAVFFSGSAIVQYPLKKFRKSFCCLEFTRRVWSAVHRRVRQSAPAVRGKAGSRNRVWLRPLRNKNRVTYLCAPFFELPSDISTMVVSILGKVCREQGFSIQCTHARKLYIITPQKTVKIIY